jgi:predicted DNA-binding transcriptional regulator YafY
MRADRLLSILLLLQGQRRITARDLALRLEVSARTIHRDMTALGAAGVPIMAARGAGGGWSLSEAYSTDLTGLTTIEARSLFLAAPARVLADLGLRQASEGALIKLLAALPAAARRDAEYTRQRIYIDAAGWQQSGEHLPCLAAVQDAVWRERRLAIIYGRGDGSVVERVVDPLGLVAKGRLWYLVAAVESEPRSYRVDRIREAVPTEQRSARPAGFDLPAYWDASVAGLQERLPRYRVEARVDPAMLPRMRFSERFVRVELVGERDADGWEVVTLHCQGQDEACAYVLGFGPNIAVLAPEDLREQVVASAHGIISCYERHAPQILP